MLLLTYLLIVLNMKLLLALLLIAPIAIATPSQGIDCGELFEVLSESKELRYINEQEVENIYNSCLLIE